MQAARLLYLRTTLVQTSTAMEIDSLHTYVHETYNSLSKRSRRPAAEALTPGDYDRVASHGKVVRGNCEHRHLVTLGQSFSSSDPILKLLLTLESSK